MKTIRGLITRREKVKVTMAALPITGLALASILVQGCGIIEEEEYEYNGKTYTLDQLEEVIESEIEMQNPDEDFDVNINFDSD